MVLSLSGMGAGLRMPTERGADAGKVLTWKCSLSAACPGVPAGRLAADATEMSLTELGEWAIISGGASACVDGCAVCLAEGIDRENGVR